MGPVDPGRTRSHAAHRTFPGSVKALTCPGSGGITATATAASCDPTAHLSRSTATSSHRTERSTPAPDKATRSGPPHVLTVVSGNGVRGPAHVAEYGRSPASRNGAGLRACRRRRPTDAHAPHCVSGGTCNSRAAVRRSPGRAVVTGAHGSRRQFVAVALARASSRWRSTRPGEPEMITNRLPSRIAVCLTTLLHPAAVNVRSWLHC